ncbi:ribosome assembly RNA-binding protein YhbY [Myxococcota bacterium]|nr:ribosome assembly RNA-binding protein YhbY [Myxococcota bacterium]
MELSGFQRRYLRQRAHPLRPVVHVGGAGVSREVVNAVDRALLDHELVKVRLHEPQDKRAMARELAESASAQLAGLVGHTVILYRAHPEEPRIELPTRPGA